MKSILVIEDDVNLNNGISLHLEKEGYKLYSAYRVSEALALYQANHIDLIISDINLPDGKGTDLCRKIRETDNVYLIFLTILSRETEILKGYQFGADDYITKPFSLTVLVNKVDALLRRGQPSNKKRMQSDNLRVEVVEQQGYLDNQFVEFDLIEWQILICLMRNANQLVSYEELLGQIKAIVNETIDRNELKVRVNDLNLKVGNDKLKVVKGVGYIWVAEVKSTLN